MEVDREGDFRAEIVEFGLRELDSKAVCVPIRAKITEFWNGEAWDDWRQYDMHAGGDIWIGKKDGSANDKQIEALMRHAGWDGSLAALVDGSWHPTPCQITVKQDSYEGKTTYKIAWLNAFDRTPGGGSMSNVDEAKVKGLEARFGQTLRALSGNVRRNAAAPSGRKPPAPPKASSVPAGAANGDIPF